MFYRGRRLRKNETIRKMVKENELLVSDLIYPIFVVEGTGIKEEISSLKGNYHYSVDRLDEVIHEMQELGVLSCILFGLPDHKDACGSEAYNDHGVVQEAFRKIKSIDEYIYVICDVCMCEYTDHGHCGILDEKGNVLNDVTLEYLSKIALSYARAGVDMVAPSDMMDGRIQAIRTTLDENGFYDIPIMSYASKFASNYYGPFREAAGSAPAFGNRKTYQMDYANGNEAMREVAADLDEGADIIIVKPAMAYLDIMKDVRDNFNVPICAYNVSGEYAMLYNAVEQGLVNEDIIYETLLSMKRAGAKLIITYFALDIARKMKAGLL